MVKVKSIKEIDMMPYKGYYSKIARTIIEQFFNDNHEKAEIELEGKKSEIQSVYNAMYSLIRRNKMKLKISININDKTIYMKKAD